MNVVYDNSDWEAARAAAARFGPQPVADDDWEAALDRAAATVSAEAARLVAGFDPAGRDRDVVFVVPGTETYEVRDETHFMTPDDLYDAAEALRAHDERARARRLWFNKPRPSFRPGSHHHTERAGRSYHDPGPRPPTWEPKLPPIELVAGDDGVYREGS